VPLSALDKFGGCKSAKLCVK